MFNHVIFSIDKKLYRLILLLKLYRLGRRNWIEMTAVLVLFVVLLNQGYFCLKTLNFENLKYVERTKFYYFDMNNVTAEGINVARKVKKNVKKPKKISSVECSRPLHHLLLPAHVHPRLLHDLLHP